MKNNDILDKVKISLRMKSNQFDSEILDHIEAAKHDLLMTGIKNINLEDALIVQAIKYYCRANFALDNKDSEKFRFAYENLRDKLALIGEYTNE